MHLLICVRHPCYAGSVEKTLTIRLDGRKDKALTRHAKELGKTKSEFVRELIDRALLEEPMGKRIGHLRGCVTDFPEPGDGWRKMIKERNWRD